MGQEPADERDQEPARRVEREKRTEHQTVGEEQEGGGDPRGEPEREARHADARVVNEEEGREEAQRLVLARVEDLAQGFGRCLRVAPRGEARIDEGVVPALVDVHQRDGDHHSERGDPEGERDLAPDGAHLLWEGVEERPTECAAGGPPRTVDGEIRAGGERLEVVDERAVEGGAARDGERRERCAVEDGEAAQLRLVQRFHPAAERALDQPVELLPLRLALGAERYRTRRHPMSPRRLMCT